MITLPSFGVKSWYKIVRSQKKKNPKKTEK